MSEILGHKLTDIEAIKTDIVIQDYIPIHKGNYNILAGNGGTGKSLISLKMLVHFLRANPDERAVALYTEDARSTIMERLQLITKIMNVDFQDILDRTFFKTLDNHDGKVFASKVNKQNTINEEYFTKFVMNAKFYKIGLVILDPFEAFHNGLSENDAEDMKFFTVEALQKLGVLTGAGILVLHHTNKGALGGARGSGVITNKARVAYNIRKIMEHDKILGIDKIKKGWEQSVLLTTIKDNHFITKNNKIIQSDNGKLDLPVHLQFTNEPIFEAEFEGLGVFDDN